MKFKRVWQRLTSLLYVLILVAVLLLAGSVVFQKLNGVRTPMVFGWGVARVVSGSMEPEIPVGSMIAIKKQESYGLGDVVTYLNVKGNPVTHRIVSINGNEVIAQGDANNTEDEPFDVNQIIGKVRCVIPDGRTMAAVVVLSMVGCLSLWLLLTAVGFPTKTARNQELRRAEDEDEKN